VTTTPTVILGNPVFSNIRFDTYNFSENRKKHKNYTNLASPHAYEKKNHRFSISTVLFQSILTSIKKMFGPR